MGGGLMQLVAYGAQDIYLTGNPQITFFKVVYRRHTNFSMESIKQTFNGTADFGSSSSATISRNGDLVYRMYLEHSITLSDSGGGDSDQINNYGHALIKECELEIGGQRIDKHYGRWMQIWSDLTEFNPTGHNAAADAQTAFGETGTLFQRMCGTGKGTENDDTVAAQSYVLFIPLQFWFCRNPGLALPLIALQYHEVKVKMTFTEELKLIADDGATLVSGTPKFDLWCDYIYLDTDERRRFAQVSHEYLIEQLQYENKTITSGSQSSLDLNFNHPVKEIIFQGSNSLTDDVALGTVAGLESTLCCGQQIDSGTVQLKLNGHDRFKERDYRYFTRTQIWQHHTGFGGSIAPDSIGVYSFSLKPEEHQPSGTCNFSRIDNAQLVVNLTAEAADGTPGRSGSAHTVTNLHIYAVNYNVLRIMSGMGGLAYSN
jgi:hypothetical protein